MSTVKTATTSDYKNPSLLHWKMSTVEFRLFSVYS